MLPHSTLSHETVYKLHVRVNLIYAPHATTMHPLIAPHCAVWAFSEDGTRRSGAETRATVENKWPCWSTDIQSSSCYVMMLCEFVDPKRSHSGQQTFWGSNGFAVVYDEMERIEMAAKVAEWFSDWLISHIGNIVSTESWNHLWEIQNSVWELISKGWNMSTMQKSSSVDPSTDNYCDSCSMDWH